MTVAAAPHTKILLTYINQVHSMLHFPIVCMASTDHGKTT